MAQARDGRNAVADLFDGADFFHVGLDIRLFDSFRQAFRNGGKVREGPLRVVFGHGVADLFHLTLHAGVINLIAGF